MRGKIYMVEIYRIFKEDPYNDEIEALNAFNSAHRQKSDSEAFYNRYIFSNKSFLNFSDLQLSAGMSYLPEVYEHASFKMQNSHSDNALLS